jgi:hypothetical protein
MGLAAFQRARREQKNQPVFDRDYLSELTVKQLQEIANEIGLTGYSSLKKSELRDLIIQSFEFEEIDETEDGNEDANEGTNENEDTNETDGGSNEDA